MADAKAPWPPDEVLRLVGLSREEWDTMEEAIGRENLPLDWVLESALRKSVRRRREQAQF